LLGLDRSGEGFLGENLPRNGGSFVFSFSRFPALISATVEIKKKVELIT